MAADPEIKRLAAVIARLEARVNALSGTRLTRSSIEDGAIDEYDADGQLSSVIGRQWDGAHGVTVTAGPTPPVPAGLTLTAKPTGVLVRWDGTWAASATTVAASDHKLVEVHASATNTPGVTFETYRGEMNSARGGELIIPTSHDEPLYVWLVARALSGKASAPSASVGPVAALKIEQDALEVDWDALGGNQIFYGGTEPTTDKTGDLWHKTVTLPDQTTTYEVRRWDGAAWVLVADQGVSDALLAAEAADAAAKAGAMFFRQGTMPTSHPTEGRPLDATDKAIWLNTTDGENTSWDWDGTQWVRRLINGYSIQPNSLVAKDVIATGTVTAALLESVLVIANTIIAGDYPGGPHVRMGNGGMQIYSVTPDGDMEWVGSWGTGDDGIILKNPVSKASTTSLSHEGLVVPSLSLAGVDSDGDGVPDSGFDVFGREFLEYFDPLPKGIIAAATYFPADGMVASGVTTPVAIGELAFTARKGRAYHVSFDGLQCASSDGQIRGLIKIRGTENGDTPTLSNGVTYQSKFFDLPITNQGYAPPTFNFTKIWSMVGDVDVRMIVIVERFSGAVASSTMAVRTYTPSESYFSPIRWFVDDRGLAIPDTFQLNNGSGTPTEGGTAPVTAKKQYTTTWTQEWGASFEGSGTKRSDTDLYQGYTAYYPGGGIHRSLSGLVGGADYSSSSGEIGKTIVQALTGATVDKVEIKLHCNHSYLNAGGTVRIGYHGQLTEPSAIPAAAWDAISSYFRRGETKWISLPSTTYADWKSGAYRGITLGPGDGSADEYMRFEGADGSHNRPAIRITYTR